MIEQRPSDLPDKPRRRRVRGTLLTLLSIALMFLVGALGFLALTGTAMEAPGWVTERVERKINDSLTGVGTVSVETVDITVQRLIPRVHLRNVGIYDTRGVEAARLNEVGAQLVGPALMQGSLEMDALRLSGAQITVRRLADGTIDLRFGAAFGATGTLASVLDGIDRAFTTDPLSKLQRLSGVDLTITLEDARSGRIWQVTGGEVDLIHEESAMQITVRAEVFNGTEDLATTEISFETVVGSPEAVLTATFENAAARDIAAQSPAMAFLEVLDAPISGALSGAIDAKGDLTTLSGELNIGQGVLQPTPEADPIRIDAARARLSYDVAAARMDFEELSLRTAAAQANATGQAFLKDFRNGWPETMVTQVQLRDVVVRPEGLFSEPLTFAQGAADYRLRLNPFTVEIGQLALVDEGRRTLTKGQVKADAQGWTVSLNMTSDAQPMDRILAMWPVPVAPEVRDWIGRNVSKVNVADLVAAFRLNRTEPKGLFSMSFTFEGATMKPLKTLPPVTDAAGYAALIGRSFSAVLEAGTVTAPEGGEIDVAGSVFRVPDTSIQPGQAEVTIKTDSSITAALALLNLEPLTILKDSELPVAMAEGQAVLEASLQFPLLPKVTLDDVDFSVMGALQRVSSNVLVPGRVLRAGYLDMQAGPFGVAISGSGTLDAVPANVVWSQDFGPEASGSRVDGTVTIDEAFLDAFNIALPPGSLRGEGQGVIGITLPKDGPPEFRVTSDLRGLRLQLSALDWAKAAGTAGSFEVRGVLGSVPRVDAISLQAPGLSAVGDITLTEGGGLAQARFSRVQVGRWLDGPVTLIGRGGAPPSILVSGGQVDLRAASFGGPSGGGNGGGGGGPLTLQLDRLIVSEGIAFSNFTGQFNSERGFEGRFAARINGATPVTGTVVATPAGAAVRLLSDDAGGALASANILRNARGGRMDLTLNPTGREGLYDGRLIITRTRIVRTPALTDLLSAISIVGLLEQLNTGGISMAEVEAEFQLSPSRLTLLRSSGIGPSLGISLDGIYDLASDRIDMQGVISPVYFLNGIGQIFSRRGEGVFGFNFRLSGAADAPQVRVNPLSILTPGMFREIFRRPPPQPGQ